ncbi:MAG: C39 family peptidase [bacterium]|nr:C39 family peptidase [bacterium]
MSPETVKWYLERVNAYLENPQEAQGKYFLPLSILLSILNESLGTQSLSEAKEFLEKIASDLSFAKNVPDPEALKLWQEELATAEAQKREITQKTLKEVRGRIEFLKRQQALLAKIQAVLEEEDIIFAQDPKLAERVSQQIITILATELKKAEELTEVKLTEIIEPHLPELDLSFKNEGVFLDPHILKSLPQKLSRAAYEEARAVTAQKRRETQRPEEEEVPPTIAGKAKQGIPEAIYFPQKEDGGIKPDEAIFTPEVREKLAQEEEGVAFAAVYTLLTPQAAVSFLKKTVLAPIVKPLQFLDILAGEDLEGNATETWRQMLHEGLNSQDVTSSMAALHAAGVPLDRPKIRQLEKKQKDLQSYEEAHSLTSRLLRHYHEFTKITGRRQIFPKELGADLPRLVPSPLWSKASGFAFKLRQNLNQIGTSLSLYKKNSLPSGRLMIHFTLPDKITRLLTFGKVQNYASVRSFVSSKMLKPVLGRLAKTALGKAIKKGAVALLAKLGLAAIPTGVTQVAAAALLIKDALGLVKKLFKNPALLAAVGFAAVGLSLFLALGPLLIPALIIAGTAIGAIVAIKAFGGAIVTTAGNLLGGLASTASGLLSSLGSISIPALLPGAPIVAAVGGTGVLTVMMLTQIQSSFIPKPTQNVGQVTPYGACSLSTNAPGSGALKEQIINASQWAGIPPAILAGIASIEGGHLFNYSDAQILQFSAPGAQDPINCEPNGCGARGPMQFLNDGTATDCGEYTGKKMPDTWSNYKDAVNQAIPAEQRDPNVCNIKDSLYAAAWMIKTLSETSGSQSCTWEKAIVDKVAAAYYGESSCSETFDRLGGKTYCDYLWDYYRNYSSTQAPSPSGWFYWQGDPQWNPPLAIYDITRYGTIEVAGCGPTTLAMVLTYWGVIKNPVEVWNEVVARNYMVSGVGMSWGAITNIPSSYGLTVQNLGTNWALAESRLNEGSLVIAATNIFGGHILIVRNINGNNLITSDPAYSNGDGFPYTKQSILLVNLWAVKK